MTEGELRAALLIPVGADPDDAQNIKLDPKVRVQLEKDLEAVVSLAGHTGWKKLHETFSEYRAQLVSRMLGSAPDAQLPTIRAKVALLDELLDWPAAFKAQAEEVLAAPKD